MNRGANDSSYIDNCYKECTYAYNSGKPCIPVVFEKCMLSIRNWPQGTFKLYFGNKLYIDGSSNDYDSITDDIIKMLIRTSERSSNLKISKLQTILKEISIKSPLKSPSKSPSKFQIKSHVKLPTINTILPNELPVITRVKNELPAELPCIVQTRSPKYLSKVEEKYNNYKTQMNLSTKLIPIRQAPVLPYNNIKMYSKSSQTIKRHKWYEICYFFK